MDYVVVTVGGDRVCSPDGGYVLPHEHLLLDQRAWWEGPGAAEELDPPGVEVGPSTFDALRRRPLAVSRENLVLSDWFIAAKELAWARRSGCQLVVDLTVTGLDPMPGLARRAADLAGVSLVVGVGRYVDGALTPAEKARGVDDLIETWLRQARDGVDGCLPGIIGEIGTSDILTDAERRSLQAAAEVQRRTGLAINLHLPTYARAGHDALDVLDRAGADLSRVVMSHCDAVVDVPWVRSLLACGCLVEFDLFGNGSDCHMVGKALADDDDRVEMIVTLCESGFAPQLLVSHDISMKYALRRYGGWGYGHLGQNVFPVLEQRLGSDTLRQLTCVNPLRLLDVSPIRTRDGSAAAAG